MLKRLLQTTLFIIITVTFSLSADNQVVTSSRLSQISSAQSSMSYTWQDYSGQLGYAAPVQSDDYDYILQMRLLQARGDINYPVTVGDVYTLSYIYNNTVVSVPVSITHSGSFSVPNIGSFTWSGKTFNELKLLLGQYDGVRIMLDSEVELVICVNNKWYINDKLYGVENEELFEKYMNFILNNL